MEVGFCCCCCCFKYLLLYFLLLFLVSLKPTIPEFTKQRVARLIHRYRSDSTPLTTSCHSHNAFSFEQAHTVKCLERVFFSIFKKNALKG